MKNIIFIAPPAAGKGTMSSILENKYGYKHISTGDLLRNAVKNEDDLAVELKNLLKTGKLVPDNIVLELLKRCLDTSESGQKFILDGFPRNINQAKYLLNLFQEKNINNYVVIYLDIDFELAMTRTLGRITCKNCGSSYNKYIESTKPKVNGICDKCQGELVIRTDDNENTFKVRYNEYMVNTRPVIDYFKEINKLYVVNVSNDIDDTLLQIERILEG